MRNQDDAPIIAGAAVAHAEALAMVAAARADAPAAVGGGNNRKHTGGGLGKTGCCLWKDTTEMMGVCGWWARGAKGEARM